MGLRKLGYLGIALLGSTPIGYAIHNLFVSDYPNELLSFTIVPIGTAAILYAADHSETVYRLARWLTKDKSW